MATPNPVTMWPADPNGSPKEWGLTREGELCETDDPRVSKLLVPVGGFIPWADAAKYGLTEGAIEPATQTPATADAGAKSGLITSRGALTPPSRRDLRTQKPATSKKHK